MLAEPFLKPAPGFAQLGGGLVYGQPPRHGLSWGGEFQPSLILLKIDRDSFPKLLGKDTAQTIENNIKEKSADAIPYPSVPAGGEFASSSNTAA